ncbi:dCTP deaminase [archaeon]|nr:dCTP deaminase [archaeon]
MFSEKDIVRALRAGELKIVPFSESNLKPNAYTFTLDSELAIARKGTVDLEKDKDFSKLFRPVRLNGGRKFALKPGAFLLARTAERVLISPSLAMMVEGRSTLARLGVSVTQTAMILEAGHGYPKPRKIVLEIANSGPFTVMIYAGMKIAKGAFVRLDSPATEPYDAAGKYGTRKNKDDLIPLPD